MKRKISWLLLIGLAAFIAVALWGERKLSEKEEEAPIASELRIGTALMEGDTTHVQNAAIFLCNERDSAYNDCECSQNIPVIEGVVGLEPVESQDIYSDHAAMVYGYSPYKSEMKVDSVHWSIEDYEPLLVAAPVLVTSHFPEINLEFRPVMGQVAILLDEVPCHAASLEGNIPLEGSVDMLTGTITVGKSIKSLHINAEKQYLLPSEYKRVKIHIGDETFQINFVVEPGMTTRIHCHSHRDKVEIETLTW